MATEQNTPAGADAPTRAAAAAATASRIEAGEQAIRDEMEGKIEAPGDTDTAETVEEIVQDAAPTDETKEETKTHGETEEAQPGDAEEQPGSTEETEPDAATQGDPLTPEEEQLLRRARVADEDLEYFRSLTVEQRNRALTPLRNQQRMLDQFFGLPPEERERAIQAARQPASPAGAESEAAQRARQKIAPSPEKLKALAEKLGVKPEDLGELADVLLEPARQYAAENETQRQQREVSDRSGALESAVQQAHPELAKKFPKLKDPTEVTRLLQEPETFAVYTAKVGRGTDHRTAITAALTERATVKYAADLANAAAARRSTQRATTLKGTAQPTSKTKGPAAAPARARSLDEAHDRVLAESRDE